MEGLKPMEMISDNKDQPYVVKLLVGIMIVLATVLGAVSYQVFTISKENIKVVQQSTTVSEKLIEMLANVGKENRRSDDAIRTELKELRAEIRGLK